MRSIGLFLAGAIGFGWLLLTIFLAQLFSEMQDPNNAMGLAGGIIIFAIGSVVWLAVTGIEAALLLRLFRADSKIDRTKTPPE